MTTVIQNNNFPPNLLSIKPPIKKLYCQGVWDLAILNKSIAIVGSRRITSYGERVIEKIVPFLVEANVTIISGMMYGVDQKAHNVCLECGGKTIAVLGCGVDIIYPPSNRDVYENILENNGLVISEFPPGHTVLKGLFVARNRLISGLSKGVIVIEGSKVSGALITARYAAEQGKEVFALPGPITSRMAQAPNLLIKQGAKLITSIDDILEEFNMKHTGKISKKEIENLEKDERVIIKIIENEPKTGDDIVLESCKDISFVLQVLSQLELKGYVQKNSEGKYEII